MPIEGACLAIEDASLMFYARRESPGAYVSAKSSVLERPEASGQRRAITPCRRPAAVSPGRARRP